MDFPSLSLSRLRVFRTVAETRGITSAARRLHVSQPAVSAQIRELEKVVGTRLVERAGRALRLTGAGQLLDGYAQRLLALEGEAVHAIARHRGLEAGSLSVAATETPGHYLLPPELGTFRRAHPTISLSVAVSTSIGVAELVEDGTAELGFVEAVALTPTLMRRLYREDRMRLILAAKDPLAKVRRIRGEDLNDRDFVMREPTALVRGIVDEGLRRGGVKPRVAFELGTTEAVKRAVRAGLGIAFVPEAAIEDDLELKRIVVRDVEGVEIRRRLWMIRQGRRPLSPAAEAFSRQVFSANG